MALLQTLFAAVLNPKMADLLVRVKNGSTYNSVHNSVTVNKQKVVTQVILELVGSLLAPVRLLPLRFVLQVPCFQMVGTFLLDESCLRCFFLFSSVVC